MEFDISIDNLNDALKVLPYLDSFKDKTCTSREFLIRIDKGHLDEKDGVVELAESDGYKVLEEKLSDDGDCLLKFCSVFYVDSASTDDHVMKMK